MDKRERAFARYEEQGEEQVRRCVLMLDADERPYAFEWLERRNEASRTRSDAAQAEQARTARIAKNAAVVAAIAAIIAIPIAIAAIVISYLAWVYPHH